MKILKHGKFHSINHQVTCSNCGCEFECNQVETFQGPMCWSGKSNDDSKVGMYVNCPECENATLIKEIPTK